MYTKGETLIDIGKNAGSTFSERSPLKATAKRGTLAYSIHDLVADLKLCRDLYWGRIIHDKAVECGNNLNMYVANALISMYGKCDSMGEASTIFESIHKPNVISWTALILGYAENGESRQAFDLYSIMKTADCVPDSVTYVSVLKACTLLAVKGDVSECLERGREIHREVGCHLNHYVQTTLIDMYSKCGAMVEAREVFEGMKRPDVQSWTSLILGYAENGEGYIALDLFERMKKSKCTPNPYTYVAALRACTSSGDGTGKRGCLEMVREIHSGIGSYLDNYVYSTLIYLYAKFGSMVEARSVFESIENPNVVCWNALLLGYAENDEQLLVLSLLRRMKIRGCKTDAVTYVAALKACTYLAVNEDGRKEEFLERGRELHWNIRCHLDLFLQNTLVDMYAKCGSMTESRQVFDNIRNPDVVSWNALLLGYADNGQAYVVLEMFTKMKAAGCTPNSVTYLASLKACSWIGALCLGRKFHSEITEFTSQIVTTLVDFYAKCGSMVEAREVFDIHSKVRSVLTWNSLIAGHSRYGDSNSVFTLFERMQDEGFNPDSVTLICFLLCCSHAGFVQKATEYFDVFPAKYGVNRTLGHYNCMVDVLGRANQLNKAMEMIRNMPWDPNVITWVTLLGACRKWKNVEIGREAYEALAEMDIKGSSGYVLMGHVWKENIYLCK